MGLTRRRPGPPRNSRTPPRRQLVGRRSAPRRQPRRRRPRIRVDHPDSKLAIVLDRRERRAHSPPSDSRDAWTVSPDHVRPRAPVGPVDGPAVRFRRLLACAGFPSPGRKPSHIRDAARSNCAVLRGGSGIQGWVDALSGNRNLRLTFRWRMQNQSAFLATARLLSLPTRG